RFAKLSQEINDQLGVELTLVEVALGFVKIAHETMAKPIREVSVARGFDIREHALICFGGAAAQHACALAAILGMCRIIIHPLAGLFSAYGIAAADHLRYALQSVVRLLSPESYMSLEAEFHRLATPLITDLQQRGIASDKIHVHRYLDLRPKGADTFLSIPFVDFDQVAPTYLAAYHRHFGFKPDGVQLELVNIRVEVIGAGTVFQETEAIAPEKVPMPQPITTTAVYFGRGSSEVPVFRRKDLEPGTTIKGPAIIVEDYSTVVVEPGFRAAIDGYGNIILEQESARIERIGIDRDPVMLEVFNHLFMSVAEQMGSTLAATAHSTNIKERLDFSCAIFDQEGNLVANAPHQPVHLGAMSESVKWIIEANKDSMSQGDVYATNNPHHGGSHLPDVTVITPFFDPRKRPLFYVASRGHHADIGGTTPGSMPPFARRLEEEGVVINNLLLVRDDIMREQAVLDVLQSGTYPARNLPERLSDLRAQIAANTQGVRELQRLIDKYSQPTIQAYMQHIRNNATEALRDALGRFIEDIPQFESSFEDYLDDGSRIKACVIISRGERPPESHRAIIDFAGTSPQIYGNLNAPLAVTQAAVLYVLRALIDRDIPLNSGCLVPIEIRVPRGCLLNPNPDAAVVGGNVETSQRIVDVLLGALGLAAASQGTMNNFLFGREDGLGRQYYETIAGGAGAMAGHRGASGVQVHMTNTRITDPEVLEERFPELRLERFAIRRGSGGRGRYHGGDGVIREIRFLKPRKVSILSERRVYKPYGLAGGGSGNRGRNLLIRQDGSEEVLGGKVALVVEPGERIVIKTPGGGGYGRRKSKS
ncbi:MAG: hydantoinase B/oxoprolinase family protein, partial [Candidatus Neomarinimicrobiota bacterium]